jgi:DNA-binding response OmpR family regulator
MLKVLIAEDDLQIADMIEETLVENGYDVCGIATTVAAAVALIHLRKPDLAVIDVRLADGGLGTEIAAQLGGLGKLGVLYATGNRTQVALSAVNGHASITKPYRDTDLLRGLQLVSEILASGKASPPYPRGFQVLPGVVESQERARHG